MNIKYLISYSGLVPFIYLIIDLYFLGYLNTEFVNDIAIYMSCIIYTFIGAYNWDFNKNNIFLELHGFLPSLLSMIILLLNLFEFNQVSILSTIILLLLIQLIIDLYVTLKGYFPMEYYIKLRIPVTGILCISLYLISGTAMTTY